MSIKINGTEYNSTIDADYIASGQVDISARHIATSPELYQPQGTNHFYFYVDLVVAGDTTFNEDDTKTLRLSVKSSTVPHYTQDVISVNVGNMTMKYAGKISFDNGTIEVYDYIGADTKKILDKWQAKSGNVKTGKVGIATDYKRVGHLVETTPDGQLVRSFKMYGCWISGLSEETHTMDSSDARAITATITYDWAEMEDKD